MDSSLLKVFVAVAQEKSVTLGAKKLKSAQSNVTARIKQLEKNLGYPLFHRVPQGVILTNEGKKLYPSAIEIVKKIDLLSIEMANVTHQEQLKVASTEANATIRIVPFLLQVYKDYPNIQLELVTNTTQEITRMVLDYEVDIAFISGITKHKDLLTLNTFEEEMVIVNNNKNANNGNTYLVYKSGCAYNDFTIEYLKKNENEDYKLLKFSSYETILGCVEAGIGKSILPLSVIKKLGFENRVNLQILSKHDANIPTSMVCRKDNIPLIVNYLKTLEL